MRTKNRTKGPVSSRQRPGGQKSPCRTLQDWELGNRKMPEYLLRLMAYRIRTEELVKANKIDPDEVCVIRVDGEDNDEDRPSLRQKFLKINIHIYCFYC